MKKPSNNIFAEIARQHECHEQVLVSKSEYIDAVEALLAVARQDTGQSFVCAQLLLSLHDSYEFSMPISDLCRLDWDLFHAAVIAIRGRVALSTEIHEVIENGGERLRSLCQQWGHLRNSQRFVAEGRY